MKIASVIPVYNREYFIGPHLDMLLEMGIYPIVVLGDTYWGWMKEHDEVKEKDRTEEIVLSYGDKVKLTKGNFADQKDQLNEGLRHVAEFERVIVTDVDMFWTLEDWEDIKKLLEVPADVFFVQHGIMIIEYFYSMDYGTLATPGGAPPIFAIKPGSIVMKNMTSVEGWEYKAMRWTDWKIKFHHLRYVKEKNDKRFQTPPIPTLDMHPIPMEIRKRFEKYNHD